MLIRELFDYYSYAYCVEASWLHNWGGGHLVGFGQVGYG